MIFIGVIAPYFAKSREPKVLCRFANARANRAVASHFKAPKQHLGHGSQPEGARRTSPPMAMLLVAMPAH